MIPAEGQESAATNARLAQICVTEFLDREGIRLPVENHLQHLSPLPTTVQELLVEQGTTCESESGIDSGDTARDRGLIFHQNVEELC